MAKTAMDQLPPQLRTMAGLMERAYPLPVCGVTFVQHYVLAYSQAAGRLRRTHGWPVVSEPCPLHNHRSNIAAYRLEHLGAEQLELI